jgi:cellulose synthase/poly-beta-1,6-N-acetylglucosamine synthase-like glycosyltransferase
MVATVERATRANLQQTYLEAWQPTAVHGQVVLATFIVALTVGSISCSLVALQFVDAGMRRMYEADGVTLAGAGLLVFGFISSFIGLRWSVLFALSFRSYLQGKRASDKTLAEWPFVSIFVPAYNESATIEAALESLLELDYPRFEVIVVDDGSKDDTFEKALRFADEQAHCPVRVFSKPNGGKWSAHNFAFAHSTGELILCLDADSRINRDSLRRLVRHMTDPSIAGVAGQIRVRNRHNLLTRLQGLEYLMANGLIRMAQNHSGTVLVVPGPIGLFRRSVLEDVYIRYGQMAEPAGAGEVAGPFEGDTFAEDFDLSLTILSLGGRIVYEPSAISHTTAPDWTFALLNQRYRWARGTIQVLRKYLQRGLQDRSLFHFRLLNWLCATYLLELLVLPFIYVAGFLFFVSYLVSGYSVVPLLGWLGLFLITNLNATALFAMMHGDRLSILAVQPLYDWYHGFLLSCGWLIAMVDEFRGAKMRW